MLLGIDLGGTKIECAILEPNGRVLVRQRVPTEAEKGVAHILGNIKKIICPVCKSYETKLISQFGSTACKALYQCEKCLEPFDYFKCI